MIVDPKFGGGWGFLRLSQEQKMGWELPEKDIDENVWNFP